MLNATLISLKTSQLFTRRIDPVQLTSQHTRPDPDPGPYRSPTSRARPEFQDERGQLCPSAQVDIRKEFWNIGVQTIIEVFSINLDPQNPDYPGEEWHVQGRMVNLLLLQLPQISSTSTDHGLTP